MHKTEALKHYGILGMKWGKRKSRSSKSKSTSTKKESRSVKKMSNREIQSRIKRLQLEKQYSSITAKKKSKGRKIVESILSDSAKRVATEYVSKQMSDIVNKKKG